MGQRSSQSCYSSHLAVKNEGRRTCMGLQNSVRRSTYNTSGCYSGVASNGTREDTVNKPPDLKEGMRCHPAVVCSTIRNGPPAGFTGMCACVLVCEWLRAEGGFIELCWVAAAPEPRATKKHFIVVLWRWPCCVVNTFVCGVMRLQIKKIGAVFLVLSREFPYPS